MGPLQFSALLLGLQFLLLQTSPAQALGCTSQNFSGGRRFSNCTDLPTLNSSLHWTYDPSNSTLSVAFVAAPSKADGWIAWAINPTGSGMVGAQALVALKKPDGSATFKTYNISSYKSIVESKLAFRVWGSGAEHSGGVMMLFAMLEIPNGSTTLNHVWQVGGSVMDGMPAKHEFAPANLNAKGVLQLTAKDAGSGGGGGSSGNDSSKGGGASGAGKSMAGICLVMLFLLNLCFGFLV